MTSVSVKTTAGAAAGDVELAADVFGIQPNVPVMHQVVTAQLAARRAGTQSTLTRSEVRGGGRKPHRQKGTGGARQGSIRAPHYSGGGVALGPKPRNYGQKTPKKMIKLALRSALSDRAAEGKIMVVDSWAFAAPSTKSAVNTLAAIGAEGKVLVVLSRDDVAAAKSFRNLASVQIIGVHELNAYDVLCNDTIVFSSATLPTGEPKPEQPELPVAPAAAKKITKKVAEVAEVAEVVEAEVETSAAVQPLVDLGDDTGAEAAAAPRWAGSVEADGDDQPEGYDIKGNAQSMLYHVPGSRYYKATKAEYWFDSEESAIAAGFSKPGAASNDDDASSTGDES